MVIVGCAHVQFRIENVYGQVVMGFTNSKVRTIITTDSMNVSGDAVFVRRITR